MERGTILVVDDEPNIADLVELYLRRDGYRVVKAGTGDDGLRAPSSRTVMMFAQDLHRTLRIFPRTLSSAMEYLVWQRSQTNFMSLQRFAPPRPFRPKPVGKLSSKGQDYHRPDPHRDEGRDGEPGTSR